VIRKVIKLGKENPQFLLQMFVIFKHIDNLHEARILRMTNLKKVMARQIVEQNSLKFEITEKMNNLVNIANYKQKYGKICKEVDEYYKKIEANPPRAESKEKSAVQQLSVS
jgi:hypothetical protein